MLDNFFGHIFLGAHTVQMVSNTHGCGTAIINDVFKTLDTILFMKEDFVEDQPIDMPYFYTDIYKSQYMARIRDINKST